MLHRSGFPSAANAFAGSSPLPPATGASAPVIFVTAPSGPGGETASLMQPFYPFRFLLGKLNLGVIGREIDVLRVFFLPHTVNVGAFWREIGGQTVDLGASRREIEAPTIGLGEKWRKFDPPTVDSPPQYSVIDPETVQFPGFRPSSPGKLSVIRPFSRVTRNSCVSLGCLSRWPKPTKPRSGERACSSPRRCIRQNAEVAQLPPQVDDFSRGP